MIVEMARAFKHIARNAHNIIDVEKKWQADGLQEYRITFVNKEETDEYLRNIEEADK